MIDILRFIKRILLFLVAKWKFGRKVKFDFSCQIGLNSVFEGMNKIHTNASFSGYMGLGSYIGPNCKLSGKIGRFTSIAPFVSCNSGTHPLTNPFATTCPMFYSTTRVQTGSTFATKQMFNEHIKTGIQQKYSIIIGNDCWIGEKAFINGGVTIHDGAVVLAGTVVSKDVPPYAIVGGIPAKILRYRYDDETIKFLLNFQWWNRNIEWLKKNWELLCDIEQLKEMN